jgi:glycosyltransferase involved in cell wall biosynthesis
MRTNELILNVKDGRPTIVCFAESDWWYHNRGLFSPVVMSRLAKHYKVLYVNSLGLRVPSLRKDPQAPRRIFRKFLSTMRFLRKTDNGMYVFTPVSLPLFGHTILGPLVVFLLLLQIKLVINLLSFKEPIFYVGCPTAWEVVKKLHPRYLICQRTDILEEMPGVNRSYISSLIDALIKGGDLVLYVNTGLWREGCKKNPNSLLIGHGVDFEQFASAEQSSYVPEDISTIPKPIIGFFGDISDIVCDFALLEHVATRLPNMSLVLVGPTSSDVSRLKMHKNIFLLGQKPYKEIQHYGKVFDVAIMPWKQNKWVEYCDPVKTKEYLALGKPVVSVDYPELRSYHDIVYASSSYDQFVEDIRKAVKEDDPELKRKRQERVRNQTWDSKVKKIVEFIEEDFGKGESSQAKGC